MRLAAGLLACVLLAGGVPMAAALAADAPGSAELARRQAEAERRRQALRERIEKLQKEIEARESDRKEAADALRESETAISRLTQRLDELDQAIGQVRQEIAKLQAAIVTQQKELDVRRYELAQQLRMQYASGLSPWTALLSGDDPQDLGRNLAYLGYVSRARADKVQALRDEIARLQDLQRQESERRAELQALQEQTAAARIELMAQRKERATVLARLEGQLQAQRSEAGKLDRDERRLAALIEELSAQVAAARRAEEERRLAEERRRLEEERRRAEQARRAAELARQQAEEARRRAEQARAEVARRADEQRLAAQREAEQARREAERQARLAQQEQARAEQARDEAERPVARGSLPDAVLAEGPGLQGALPRPVQGPIRARFGTERPDGGKWRGLLIQAPEGTAVRAVAPGTVVYADWLRGFGNLIIVDHGNQYLSVYAYNQSLLKRVGQTVSAGEPIATVGSTGGQVESGLYFEIRHRGAPQDPAKFLAR